MTDDEAPEAPQQAPPQHILLLVEDDGEIGDFLADALREITPYHPLHVTNAVQALEAVATLTPSLFILDYHLPGIDGLELGDRLRAIKGLGDVPMLMLSANPPSRKALQERGIRCLAKPFDLGTLLKGVEELLPTQPN